MTAPRHPFRVPVAVERTTPVREWRCVQCGKLLSVYRVAGCLWEQRICPRCATLNVLEVCERAA